MPTELDRTLDAIMDRLTAEGAPAETVAFERNGTAMPALKNAPPSLVHYFGHYCMQHKDAVFLVDGDCRLTFGETYAAARHVAAGLLVRHSVKRGDRVGNRPTLAPSPASGEPSNAAYARRQCR